MHSGVQVSLLAKVETTKNKKMGRKAVQTKKKKFFLNKILISFYIQNGV